MEKRNVTVLPIVITVVTAGVILNLNFLTEPYPNPPGEEAFLLEQKSEACLIQIVLHPLIFENYEYVAGYWIHTGLTAIAKT